MREGKTVTIFYRGEPVAEIRRIRRHQEQTIEERLDDLQRRGVLVRSGAPRLEVSSRLRVGREHWRGSWLSVAIDRRIHLYVGVGRPSPSPNRSPANSNSSRLTTGNAPWPPRSVLSPRRDCIRREARGFNNLFPVRHLPGTGLYCGSQFFSFSPICIYIISELKQLR